MKRNNLVPGLLFGLLVAVSVGLFFVPAFIIRPFRPQSPAGLTLAMAVRQQAPLWSLVAAGAALVLAVVLWGRTSAWKRILLVLGVGLASAAAVMTRVDYFEWMFHPVAAPGFESAENVKLDPAQMVMAVRFGSDSRAYPIRAMAYHHVVNDTVGGVPVAVTY
ncbi:MAG: DUF3179 domain-containing protein [Acidobacteriia bacterium]|nr:DUF3179 domain-containing protein [Terriglobia bacterium]